MVRILTLHRVGGGGGHTGHPITGLGQILQLGPKLTGERLLRHPQVRTFLLAWRHQHPVKIDCGIRVAVGKVTHHIPK